MFFVCLVAGWNVGGVWFILVGECMTLYLVFLMPYAYRKTRICSVEVMLSARLFRWPQVFRRMYKARARQMRWLYFPAAGMVVAKVIIFVVFGIRWIAHVF